MEQICDLSLTPHDDARNASDYVLWNDKDALNAQVEGSPVRIAESRCWLPIWIVFSITTGSVCVYVHTARAPSKRAVAEIIDRACSGHHEWRDRAHSSPLRL